MLSCKSEEKLLHVCMASQISWVLALRGPVFSDLLVIDMPPIARRTRLRLTSTLDGETPFNFDA